MRLSWCVLALGVAVSGCDGQPLEFHARHSTSDGAVSVRVLPVDAGHEQFGAVRFEIVVSEPGWLHVGIDRDAGAFSMQVSDAPLVFHLRTQHAMYSSRQVLDQFVAPLFGSAAADRLRDQDAEDTLVVTTIALEGGDDGGVSGYSVPIIARIPGAASRHYAARLGSAQRGDDTLRLATWAYAPGSVGQRSVGVGMSDEVRFFVDREPVDAEAIGAVVHDLTIRFVSESLRASVAP